MHAFKDILKDFKFSPPVDYDKVRTMTVVKEDIRGGSRLVTTIQYDNGQRFEVVGDYSVAKADAKAAPKVEPITIVGEAQLKQGEAVVSTAAATASAPGAIKRTEPAPSVPATQSATPPPTPVKSDKA